ARNITQKAVQFHRWDVLKKLQNILVDIQKDELLDSNSSDENNDSDKENNKLGSAFLQNPKKRKAKGHPKSSKRIKRSEELNQTKQQNQCGNCGEYGHYRPKCPKK
ncbi:15457_t:CDS:1, partial [Racocetra fulgida]